MCGIGGIVKFGNRPIAQHQVTMLANGLQYRGNDATGVAVMYEDGSTDWFKNNVPAWKFTASDGYETWCKRAIDDREDARCVLVHTRKATKGTPYKVENNHPLVGAGKAGIIIHNGMISNDDTLFTARGWKRYAETDSDIIRALLDDHGGIDEEIIPLMSQLSGFAAIAALHPATPNKLLLLRDSNPIMIGGTEEFMAFASDKKVLHQALTPFVKRWGIVMRVHAPSISFVPMANETGWIINMDDGAGLEYHARFQCNGQTGRGNTRYNIDTNYHDRQERFAREAEARKVPPARAEVNLPDPPSSAGKSNIIRLDEINPTRSYHTPRHDHGHSGDKLPDYVICPNFQCSKHIGLTDLQRELSLDRLSCVDCSTSLANAMSAAVN